eukprot:TRINITY_DN67623_c3_g10_i1.p1 TRINITY_DN67623_c3_g10~~TRINITY_DN67623_c3_g10_i1.p1  ORF type:complete len:117 (+),score=6.78 TRINITY_DN67623_c3_g10_i1:50-400(+)
MFAWALFVCRHLEVNAKVGCCSQPGNNCTLGLCDTKPHGKTDEKDGIQSVMVTLSGWELCTITTTQYQKSEEEGSALIQGASMVWLDAFHTQQVRCNRAFLSCRCSTLAWTEYLVD